MIIYLIAFIVISCIFGIATQNIIDNKGYDEKWFWWGFFFGFIAMLVAISKPDNHAYQNLNQGSVQNKEILQPGSWKCSCGRVNPSYTGTCACGKRKGAESPAEQEKDNRFDEIKKYKELMDSGIITEEEFNKKKTELLGL